MRRSVVRVPLGERRKALESLPWVEHADVQRVLPNRIRVEITERTPVAFLRGANELSLMDAYGVILERPVEGEFRFPVVSGIARIHAARSARAAHEIICAVHEGDRARRCPAPTIASAKWIFPMPPMFARHSPDWARPRAIARRFLCTLAIPISPIAITCWPRISTSGGPAPDAWIRWICGSRGRWW